MKSFLVTLALLFGTMPFITEVKAQIETHISNDTLTIMTYNIQKQSYSENAKVIASVNPDVVAVQEVRNILSSNFSTLKKETGLDGEVCVAVGNRFFNSYYGIALLWNKKLGTPTIKKVRIKSSKEDPDSHRAYILAEFEDFCFIATHYSLIYADQTKMTEAILQEDVIKKRQKPVYIAGDLNPKAESTFINTLKASGFRILNDMDNPEHATRESGGKPDLILERNTNPNSTIINRGVPASADRTYTISDHLPYVVTLKFK